MNNLNKANFFDDMLLQYPKAMKVFLTWIEIYNNSVNWNAVFGRDINDEEVENFPQLLISGTVSDFENTKPHGKIIEVGYNEAKLEFIKWIKVPIFYDIPFEMQQGIIMRFIEEKLHYLPAFSNKGTFKNAFIICLKVIENDL